MNCKHEFEYKNYNKLLRRNICVCKKCGVVEKPYPAVNNKPSELPDEWHPIGKSRPKVTQMVIDEFTKVLDAQDEKGMAKYGVSIDEGHVDENGDPYDWPMMAMEELADFSKYQVKEILRLRKEVNYWKRQAETAEVTANEMAEESAVMIEQLQKEVEHWKSLHQLEVNSHKETLKKFPKHSCGKHVTIVWNPEQLNKMKGIECNECGKVTFFERE